MTKSRGILPPRRPWEPVELALLAAMYPDFQDAEVLLALWRERK